MSHVVELVSNADWVDGDASRVAADAGQVVHEEFEV